MTVSELLALGGDEARERFLSLGLGYPPSEGSLALRHEIAGLYPNMGPDQILVTAGAEEAVFLFMNALLQPGDHVVVQFPCYQSLEAVAGAVGCQVTRWAMRERDGHWEIDCDDLIRSIKPNTRLIVINSPHNPTGHRISQAELEFILTAARERGILVFSDEVYRCLDYDGAPAMPACALYENAVSLGVLSKSYGLAGLRIGWAATANSKILQTMAAFKDYTSICNSAPSEFLAAEALRHSEPILRRNQAIIAANLEQLDGFFARRADRFAWSRPQAGPIAFPRLLGGRDAEAFCGRLVQEAGVLLLPAACYDFGTFHFRIGFGRRNLPEALTRLEEWLAVNPKV